MHITYTPKKENSGNKMWGFFPQKNWSIKAKKNVKKSTQTQTQFPLDFPNEWKNVFLKA